MHEPRENPIPHQIDKEVYKISPIILIVMNVLILLIVGITTFVAKDLYTEVKAYPNTTIRRDVEALEDRNANRYDALCEQLQRQEDKIDELNRFLRNKYATGGRL